MLKLGFIFNRPQHGHLATVMQDIKSTTDTHEPVSRAILMAIWIRRYDAKRIA
jgi:hypothetical protein